MAAVLAPNSCSIKPYTKDRTKMTITKDKLRDSATKRMRLKSIARAIDFFATCYDAVPGFAVNEEQKDSYLNALLREVEDMVKEVENG